MMKLLKPVNHNAIGKLICTIRVKHYTPLEKKNYRLETYRDIIMT